MMLRKSVANIITILFLCSGVSAQQKGNSTRVLFVGNSYTYFWNLPQTVSAMLNDEGKNFYIRQSTAGGISLEAHWKGEKGLRSKELIEQGDWDYVVLQNHSLSTIEDPNGFTEYGKKMADLAIKNGAKVIWYMTWSRKANPLMIQTISEGYEKIAAETDGTLIPVGLIWEEVKGLRPELELYDPDGSHPSTTGTYLTACVFYRYFSGEHLGDLPKRITTEDRNGEKLYLNIQSGSDSEFLQDVVENFYMKEEVKH